MRRRPTKPSVSPRRLSALTVLMALAFVAVGGRLVMLQIVDAPQYEALATEQRQRVVHFTARRGTIFDREGEAFAISVDLQTVYADPELIVNATRAADKLAPILDMSPVELEAKLRGTVPGSRFEYLARQIPPRQSKAIKKLGLAGIFLKPESKRYYPNEDLASHILGFSNIDGEGTAGIELQFDGILQGTPGKMTLEQDPEGRPLPQAEFTYERPRAGRSLFLSIDKDLQYYTELTLESAVQAYSAEAGTIIVLRPRSGEILALANAPDFDPNDPAASPEEAWRNRAVTDVYEPGSAYKIVTLAGALEENKVTPKTKFVVPAEMAYADRVFHDSHYHPTLEMSVGDIIEQSSNVGTIKIGLELGAEQLTRYVKKFGFGSPPGLDYPGESPGIVLPRSQWSGSTIATIPLGQGIAVTPLQMAAAYGAIANDGVWVEPKLLSATMSSNGKMEPSPVAARRRVVSRKTAAQVTRILRRVVDTGTGLEAQVPGYEVAGKTGTAQKPLPGGGYGNSYVASFAGYAPAGDPEVVAIVVLDEPSPIWGGSTAAPTFRSIMEFALRHLGIAPTHNAERDAEVIESEESSSLPAHD